MRTLRLAVRQGMDGKVLGAREEGLGMKHRPMAVLNYT